MNTVHSILRKRLLDKVGLSEKPPIGKLTLFSLYATEWSKPFEIYMRNRLVMGAMRYGKLHSKQKPTYNRVLGIKKRLGQYEATGNLECLVDIANLALLEFEEGKHPNKHWRTQHEDHCCV